MALRSVQAVRHRHGWRVADLNRCRRDSAIDVVVLLTNEARMTIKLLMASEAKLTVGTVGTVGTVDTVGTMGAVVGLHSASDAVPE